MLELPQAWDVAVDASNCLDDMLKRQGGVVVRTSITD